MQHKTQAMKKLAIITAAIMLSVGLSSFAAETRAKAAVTQKIFYQLSFSKIIVEDDIDILLSENTERVIEISGDSKYTENVDWNIKNVVLYLKSKAGSLKNKVQVSVSVSQLTSLSITGNSDVRSEGALNSAQLSVFINGEGHISLKNTGAINVEKANYVDLEVQRVSGNVRVK